MKYKKWKLRRENSANVAALRRSGTSPLCAAVLGARGISTPEEAAAFLAHGEDCFHDPFLMRDMDKAVERINRALDTRETMAIYGDYDVDGITSTALLLSFLREQGGHLISYIPDRAGEGYGLNIPALDYLASQGVKLIITVDCGITAVKEVDYARELGMDVVITDHHHCKDVIPDAVAVVDPRRPDCPYPFKDLAGVGVALKVIMALTREEDRPTEMNHWLDLAAVGTIADVMLLTNENRALVRRGLKLLAHTQRPGLAALLEESGASHKGLTASTIGYTLAPRLNAAGRMEQANVALELLLTRDPDRGIDLAQTLCDLNRTRQSIEFSIFDQCVTILKGDPAQAGPAIVLAGEGWHQGVVGIVASRLSDRYSCPSFMICLDQGKGKGSCRSFGGFNLFAALEQCADLLEGFGGHELAAGFTILEENVPAFKARMDALVTQYTDGKPMESSLDVDYYVEDPALLTVKNVVALDELEPVGAGNPRPIFAATGTVLSCTEVGGGRHLKLHLRFGNNTVLDAIFFSVTQSEARVAPGHCIDVAFTPQINDFRNCRTVQLHLCDLRPSLLGSQVDHRLYHRFCSGKPLSSQDARILLPDREDFVAIYKYIRRSASSGVLEESTPRFYQQVGQVLPSQRPYVRTVVCLDVLAERGLISLRHRSGRTRIVLHHTADKVDLEQSHLMLRLRAALTEQESR